MASYHLGYRHRIESSVKLIMWQWRAAINQYRPKAGGENNGAIWRRWLASASGRKKRRLSGSVSSERRHRKLTAKSAAAMAAALGVAKGVAAASSRKTLQRSGVSGVAYHNENNGVTVA
jgi:hypothetical protein